MSLLNRIAKEAKEASIVETMSLADYLELAKNDPSVYDSPAQRMLKAIGDPIQVDTKDDPRLSKIFSNKVINVYPTFKDFYGFEQTVEDIVAYFRHAAQGLEESKQILYMLGPVGSAKTSLAEKLTSLIENAPTYVLDGSPVFESPLGLFKGTKYEEQVQDEYNIPATAFRTIPSPWALEKLREFGGDLTKFTVRKMYPSRLRQEAVARIEPGDENNQDISALVGELDIRQLESYSQNHPYAYSFSGGLNRGNNGVVEMVEMFKTPIKVLHPLLTATQERQYTGTKAIGRLPFDGIILAHSNESEWQQFKNNKTNEAFLDRVFIVKVPYVTRVSDEVKIYEKLLRGSELAKAPCAPGTLKMLAQFCVMSRIKEPENSTLWSKMRVYDGENIKNDDPRAKPLQEYKDDAGVNEGMEGLSTRFAFKILSKTFNFDHVEVAANPIHLMYVLKNAIAEEQFPEDREIELMDILDGVLSPKYHEFLEKDITASFLDSFSDLCQNVFESYFYWADAWVSDADYRDRDTGVLLDRSALNSELERIEKPAGIASPKDFRNDVTMFVVRYKANNEGRLPRWDEFEKMRQVIEKKVIASTDEILPVISYAPKRSEADKQKHEQFVEKMKARGYTERQTRFLADWFLKSKRSV